MHQENTTTPLVGKLALALVTGVAPGSNVRASRMFTLTPTELVFEGDPTKEQLLDAYALVRWMKKSAPVFLADVMKKSRKSFGDDWTQGVTGQMQFPQFDVDRALAIGSIPTACRHITLNEEHYYVLATAPGLTTDAQRVKWSGVAVDYGMSASHLMRSIEAGRPLSREQLAQSAGRNSGMANPHAFHQQFSLWSKEVGGYEGILKMPERDQRLIWGEMEEPVRLGLALARNLGITVEVK